MSSSSYEIKILYILVTVEGKMYHPWSISSQLVLCIPLAGMLHYSESTNGSKYGYQCLCASFYGWTFRKPKEINGNLDYWYPLVAILVCMFSMEQYIQSFGVFRPLTFLSATWPSTPKRASLISFQTLMLSRKMIQQICPGKTLYMVKSKRVEYRDILLFHIALIHFKLKYGR